MRPFLLANFSSRPIFALMMNLPQIVIEDVVRRALLEDLGHGHDSTTQALIPANQNGRLVMKAREAGILAGADIAVAAFKLVDENLNIIKHLEDGLALEEGNEIISVEGTAQSILTAERVALNFMTHLSGIASETARYVKETENTKADITCTRKTLPGLRAVQKYAVRCGGGKNHRFGLDDGILIKDNHIALAGGVTQAIERARKNAGHMTKIEIEVDHFDQLHEALEQNIDAVLLDNMGHNKLHEAVGIIDGRAIAEASGGINLDTVRSIAESGVDIISVGALTHSVTALDIGLDIKL